MKYSAIMADVPWPYKTYSDKGNGRGAIQHYSTMSLKDIARLPVAEMAADDCALFFWAVDPLLPQAFEIIDAWGFTYKTVAFCWVKTNKGGGIFSGLGYWTRANQELCLLATRGRPKRLSASISRVIMAPRREHSRKPDAAYERVGQLVSGPYLDLFSRETREGWSAWGNECGKFNE